MTIRPVRPSEHAVVGDLVTDSFRALYGDLGDYEAVIRDVDDRAARASVLVAEFDDRVVGTVTYVPGPGAYAEGSDPHAAWIRMLAVDDAYRRRGIGEALTLACIDRAQADGMRRVRLNTGDPQLAAQRLYERMGFERCPDLDREIDDDRWLRAYSLDLA
jgi:ribosomal protein S18 acetylase RimI-like enzyme